MPKMLLSSGCESTKWLTGNIFPIRIKISKEKKCHGGGEQRAVNKEKKLIN